MQKWEYLILRILPGPNDNTVIDEQSSAALQNAHNDGYEIDRIVPGVARWCEPRIIMKRPA